ncbi:MAG: immunity 6 family protein [Bifidobacteriaceae bacterium]|nr:immunity 6 family protein [Bifidobacteriaceae bacterium]
MSEGATKEERGAEALALLADLLELARRPWETDFDLLYLSENPAEAGTKWYALVITRDIVDWDSFDWSSTRPAGTAPTEERQAMLWDVLADAVKPVYLIGLAELARPLLDQTANRQLADEAFGLCWAFMEGQPVAEKHFDELCHDYDDHGTNVEAELARDPQVKAAWYCLTEALAATGYWAYRAKGKVHMPEPLKMVAYEDVAQDFVSRLGAIVPNGQAIADGFLAYLQQQGTQPPRRADVIAQLARLSAAE